MEKLKQWVALSVVGVLVIGAAGWFLVISPRRDKAAEVRLQAAQKVSDNATLQSQIQVLKAQAKQLPQQQAKIAAVAAKIPDNPALPTLIRKLSDAADDAGVELLTLAPSAPTPVGVTPGSKAPVGAAGAAGQLQSIGVTLNVVGGYFQIEQFLDRVENMARAMKVGGFSVTPGANPLKPSNTASSADSGKSLTANITGTVYMATGRTTIAAPTVAGK